MVHDVTELTRLVELDYYSQVLIITMPGQDPLESFVLTVCVKICVERSVLFCGFHAVVDFYQELLRNFVSVFLLMLNMLDRSVCDLSAVNVILDVLKNQQGHHDFCPERL